MEEYETLLEGIGLSRGEIKVYLTLLKIGETTTGKIIENAQLSGSKVYVILEKLIQKGLVTYIIKEKTKYFTSTSPKRIIDYVKEKKRYIEEKETEIERILPGLMKIREIEGPPSMAMIYKGYEGIKTAIYETADLLHEDDEWLAFGVGAQLSKRFTDMWNHFNSELEARGIHIKFIVSNTHATRGMRLPTNVEIRMIENDALAPVSIANDVVIIYNWKEPSVIKIMNSETADSFRAFFNNIWDISRG